MGKLLIVERGDLIVGQVESLESIVAHERVGLDIRDVVVTQVKLHHDFEVLKRVDVDFLEVKKKTVERQIIYHVLSFRFAAELSSL